MILEVFSNLKNSMILS